MTVTTYHKKKIYVPTEVREKMGLTDGDELEVIILDKKSFKVELTRKTVDEQIMEAMTKSKEVGVPTGLARREIYENIS